MEQFERYTNDLLYWNEKVNLISRRDTEHIWLHHILHSVAIAFTGELPKSGKVLDIGTGGGLPGIPLKILNPKFDVTLLDSIAKKVQTVGMIAGHITVHGLRAVRERGLGGVRLVPDEHEQAIHRCDPQARPSTSAME